jgi:hypothetical protein
MEEAEGPVDSLPNFTAIQACSVISQENDKLLVMCS